MNSESFLKSKIALFILGFYLQDNGYTVIPYKENISFDYIMQTGIVKDNKISELLVNTPTFIAINKKKEPLLLQVKFRGKGRSGRNVEWGYKQMVQHWPDAHLIIVSDEYPHFFAVKEGSVIPFSESTLFKGNKKPSKEIAGLVKKFLSN